MELTTFYAVLSGACFALVGLWWNVLGRRPDLTADPDRRRLAGGVYLSFLLPALMGMFAQIDPPDPWVWRSTFAAVAAFGCFSTVNLVRRESRAASPGPFSKYRWLVAVLYAVVALLGISPGLATGIGLTGLQAAAAALVLLVMLAHGLTWELMVDREDDIA